MNHDTPFVPLILRAWNTQVTNINKLLQQLPDDIFQRDISPGKNSGTYILGHLVTTSDALLPLMGFGPQLYPDLTVPFLKSPDKAGHPFPSVSELKSHWTKVNEVLAAHIEALTDSQWLDRHTAVSEDDFKKEPHRNRLNVLISRTTHLSYHYGQLVLLRPTTTD